MLAARATAPLEKDEFNRIDTLCDKSATLQQHEKLMTERQRAKVAPHLSRTRFGTGERHTPFATCLRKQCIKQHRQ